MIMNKYKEIKAKHQAEVDNFPMFFAFNKEQFKEGAEKLGIKESEYSEKIMSIGYGGYIRKTDKDSFKDLIKRHGDEIQAAVDADKTGEGFIKDMFYYELCNHEYSYTRDISDALYALDLEIDDINKDERLIKGLHLATAQALEEIL